jgi:hemerythrin
MPIEWTEKLAVGFKEIDDQHKELFKKVNDLFNAMKQGKGRDEINTVIKFLEEYTVFHFSNEEKYMMKYAYPEYKEHKAQHDGLINDLKKIKSDIAKDGVNTLQVIDLQRNLTDWLMVHIGKVDVLLGKYLHEKVK